MSTHLRVLVRKVSGRGMAWIGIASAGSRFLLPS